MLPSEILRLEISLKYNINLEDYKWNNEFLQSIFSIELDKDLEDSASTLKEIYDLGFNIGHCGLTSRYIARKYSKAKLFYGKAKLLVGTLNSPNGEHAWTIIDNCLIDSTLMISIPLELAKNLGYVVEKEIEQNSARLLSEYDTFENEFIRNKETKKRTILK